jgi:ribosomal protein S18 acetylase RimI-like enzyme
MPVKIVSFRDTHLEEAAALLALRHQGDHALESALPEHFTQGAVAHTAVEATWSKPDASGVVALDAGRMIGYLIGVPRINLMWGRSVWVDLAGHAVDRRHADAAEVYRDLYAALSPSWVSLGCYAHYALIPASDRAALEAWFALSFGKEQAYGICETALASALSAPADPTLSIRRAELADLEATLELDEIIGRYQSRSPVYSPFSPSWAGTREQLRQESLDLLHNEHAMLWLALRSGQLVGYQLYLPASLETDNLLIPEQCSYLAAAVTREEERGRGVGRTLTRHGLVEAATAGFTRCITDWRVTNLLSSRFFPRQGFRPVAYRLSRRLDERIAWAHGESSPSPWLPRKLRP